MNLRKVLLRVMLAALAAAACSGVLAIIVPHTDFAWRLAAMGGCAAVATALMMSMSRWVDVGESRRAGLFGMSVCVLEFVLAVALVWADVVSRGTQEFIGLAMLAIAMTGVPAILCVRMVVSPASRPGGLLGLAGLAVSLACLLYSAADETFNIAGRDDRWWQTGFSIYFPAFLIALCMIGLTRPDPRRWRWIGVLGALAALGMSMYGIWIKSSDDPTPLVVAYTVAAVIAHALLCLRLTIPDSCAWVRIGTIAAAAATGALICGVAAVGKQWDDPYGLWRLATGAGIIAASGTMALLVLNRFAKRAEGELAPTELTSVSLTCPRCARKLTLPIGGGACQGCQLRIKITLENPRCIKCDYDLSNITAGKCPECGTPISPPPPSSVI